VPRGPSQRFNNSQAQWVTVAFGALLLIIGLSSVAESEPSAPAFLAFGLFTVLRGWRSSSVTVERDAAVTRSIVRTRRFPFAELARIEVAVGRTGMNGFGREHLVFHPLEGAPFAFKELNAKHVEGGYSVVVQAARAIDTGIQRQRA
jgi:hypothetical protein